MNNEQLTIFSSFQRSPLECSPDALRRKFLNRSLPSNEGLNELLMDNSHEDINYEVFIYQLITFIRKYLCFIW
jgi:hypothetical protein